MQKLLLFIAIFFCLESCKNHKPKTLNETLKKLSRNKDINVGNLNFKFDLPSGWQRFDTTVQGLYACLLYTNDSVYKPTINVTTEYMKGLTHEEYFKGAKESVRETIPDMELLDEGRFDVFNNNCLWFINIGTNAFDGVKREKVVYSIAIDGISYNISAVCIPGGLKKYRRVFDSIVQSFNL